MAGTENADRLQAPGPGAPGTGSHGPSSFSGLSLPATPREAPECPCDAEASDLKQFTTRLGLDEIVPAYTY